MELFPLPFADENVKFITEILLIPKLFRFVF